VNVAQLVADLDAETAGAVSEKVSADHGCDRWLRGMRRCQSSLSAKA